MILSRIIYNPFQSIWLFSIFSIFKCGMVKYYLAMQEMIFKNPPTWNEIITAIDQFENEFN